VIVATRGRPEILPWLVKMLESQTRPPDVLYVSATSKADYGDLSTRLFPTVAIEGAAGLTSQRNRALTQAERDSDAIVFFDDDFFPSRFWLENLQRLLEARDDIAIVNGHILADGAGGAGFSIDEANCIVAEADAKADRLRGHGLDTRSADLRDIDSPYGCNMALTNKLTRGLRFDENLPLYGWLEDCDFGYSARQRGRVVVSPELFGVHLGVKHGRTSGVRLGASQVINPLYLLRKGSMSPRLVAVQLCRNIGANLLKSIVSEPYVDRRGRLLGNLIALGHIAVGRCDPGMVTHL